MYKKLKLLKIGSKIYVKMKKKITYNGYLFRFVYNK